MKAKKLDRILRKDKSFNIQNGALCFLPGDRLPEDTAGDTFLGKIQNFFKQYGSLYYSLVKIFSPFISSQSYQKTVKGLLKKYGEEHVIINLGSGPNYFEGRKDIINVDIFAFDETDIVADALDLPIENGSADFIINIVLLEHVANPGSVVEEMKRILRPGGEFLCAVPFNFPFHAAPHDYYRWTREGLKELLAPFDEVEVDICVGPTSGMLWVVLEWLSIAFSFGSRTLHDVLLMALMLITFPVKLLDLVLVRFACAENIASVFYAVGRKGDTPQASDSA